MSQGSKLRGSGKDLTGMNILVIDDEPTLQLGIKYALVSEGATVDTASSGRDGISLAAENAYDIIVLDRKMPQMDGIECMELLRSSDDKTTIILMGANLPPESIVRCAACGVVDFLGKPLVPTRLRDAVNRALGYDESSFSKMVAAAREKDWEGALSYLPDLEPSKRKVWEVFLDLALGRQQPGESDVCKGGVCSLGAFEG